MKIAKIETAWLRLPCAEPQGLSGGPMTHSTDALCRITTDSGIRGIGEGRGAPLHEICHIIQHDFAPLLINENPLHNEYLWSKLYGSTIGNAGDVMDSLSRAESGTVRGALCAVDLALWDIKGKAAGMSICELLGGNPRPVLAYIQKGFYVEGQTLADMADEAVYELQAGGYRHLKMRIGRNGIHEAEERVSTMRTALGEDTGLMVDVNSAWDAAETVEAARVLEPYNLVWMEEPVPRTPKGTRNDDYDWNKTLGRIGEQISIPLAAGESHRGLYECRELIEHGRPKYMQLDIVKQSGGLTEWRKVAGMCQAHGILMAPHHAPHFHVQLVAAAPNGYIVECCDNKRQHPSWPDLFHGFPEVHDGHMDCPSAPGWGMEINDDMVKNLGTIVSWG